MGTQNPGDDPWQSQFSESDKIGFVTIPVDLQAQSAPSSTTSPIVISQNCNSQVPFHQVIAHNRDRESAVSGSNPGNCNETSRDSELKDVFDVASWTPCLFCVPSKFASVGTKLLRQW